MTPHTKCRLKLLKQERIKDYLLMEEEFIKNQERLKPQEEKNEEERSKVILSFRILYCDMVELCKKREAQRRKIYLLYITY